MNVRLHSRESRAVAYALKSPKPQRPEEGQQLPQIVRNTFRILQIPKETKVGARAVSAEPREVDLDQIPTWGAAGAGQDADH